MSTGGEKGSTGGGEKGGGAGGGGGSVKTPADFLKSIRGRPVVVKLNSGVDYRGFFPFPFPLLLLCYSATGVWLIASVIMKICI